MSQRIQELNHYSKISSEYYSLVENNLTTRSLPFGYYGSKKRIANQIIMRLPPHNAWVEAFCGSASITLLKPQSYLDIINDIDGNVVNFFRQLRNNRTELINSLALTPYAREEYQESYHILNDDNDIEKARKFVVNIMMTINGIYGSSKSGFSVSQSYSRGNREARVNRWYNLPEKLSAVADRLKSVRIENRNAIDLLDTFQNRPATLVYLDPPYLTPRNTNYHHDANNPEFHEALLQKLDKANCMIVLSGYDSEIYNDILKPQRGWTKTLIETTTRGTDGIDKNRTEVVWHNKVANRALKTGRVPIRLSKEEKQQKKINPERTYFNTKPKSG